MAVYTPARQREIALLFLRRAAEAEGGRHFDDHVIEFRDDGWTVQHPIVERITGSLFDCDFAHWDAGDIGYRGRFVLYQDDEGQLNIGSPVER